MDLLQRLLDDGEHGDNLLLVVLSSDELEANGRVDVVERSFVCSKSSAMSSLSAGGGRGWKKKRKGT